MESLCFFFRIASSPIVNSVCWSHALDNGTTSKRPVSDGGRCSGQLLMMWSAVCSGSPHSHAELSASPHHGCFVPTDPSSQPDKVGRELLIATSTFFTRGLLIQTGTQYSAAGNTRACVEIHIVLAEATQVVPARRRMSETLDVTYPATSSMCCLKFSVRSRRTSRYFGTC